jgi:hypothetical protein
MSVAQVNHYFSISKHFSLLNNRPMACNSSGGDESWSRDSTRRAAENDLLSLDNALTVLYSSNKIVLKLVVYEHIGIETLAEL